MTKAKRHAAPLHAHAAQWPGPPAVQQAVYAIAMSAALAGFMLTALALAPLALIQPKPSRPSRRAAIPSIRRERPTAEVIPFTSKRPVPPTSKGTQR